MHYAENNKKLDAPITHGYRFKKIKNIYMYIYIYLIITNAIFNIELS